MLECAKHPASKRDRTLHPGACHFGLAKPSPLSSRLAPGASTRTSRLGLDVFTIAARLRAACALERFLKNRSRDRRVIHTLSTVFPNSRSGTRSSMGIRADARAYTPARDGGPREKSCSTAFLGQPAKAEPSRLCETSRCGHQLPALQRASPHRQRRCRPILHGPASAYSARG